MQEKTELSSASSSTASTAQSVIPAEGMQGMTREDFQEHMLVSEIAESEFSSSQDESGPGHAWIEADHFETVPLNADYDDTYEYQINDIDLILQATYQVHGAARHRFL